GTRFHRIRYKSVTLHGRRTMLHLSSPNRRQLLSTAAIGLAALGTAGLFPAFAAGSPANDAIRPFRINIPEADLVDLKRRLAATRWPDKETVADDTQGVPLAMLQDLVR